MQANLKGVRAALQLQVRSSSEPDPWGCYHTLVQNVQKIPISLQSGTAGWIAKMFPALITVHFDI